MDFNFRTLRRRALLAAVLAVALVSTNCAHNPTTPGVPGTPAVSDSTLTKVGSWMKTLATATKSMQDFAITANHTLDAAGNPLMSDEESVAIVQVTTRINAAGVKVDALLKAEASLPPEARSSVLEVLKPIAAAVDDFVVSGLFGIKNPNSQTKVRIWILAAQSAIASAEIILAASGQ